MVQSNPAITTTFGLSDFGLKTGVRNDMII